MTKKEHEICQMALDKYGFNELFKLTSDGNGYIEGAKDMNEKQPYTPADMEAFWIWSFENGWYFGRNTGLWFNDDNDTEVKGIKIEEMLKLWEESK